MATSTGFFIVVRARLRQIHENSIAELSGGLAPELREELDRLSLPFSSDAVPSDAELRIAQAQLVGWLEGLFHGMQTALIAQQMEARSQLERLRGRSLPGGEGAGQVVMGPSGPVIVSPGPGFGRGEEEGQGRGTGQYL